MNGLTSESARYIFILNVIKQILFKQSNGYLVDHQLPWRLHGEIDKQPFLNNQNEYFIDNLDQRLHGEIDKQLFLNNQNEYFIDNLDQRLYGET